MRKLQTLHLIFLKLFQKNIETKSISSKLMNQRQSQYLILQLINFDFYKRQIKLIRKNMELDEHKQAERFVDQFKQIDFQVPFDTLKRQNIQIEGKKYYKDLYLVQKLLPTLTQGMIALSKQLQELMNNTDQIDEQVRQRFNPCLFLGQYLMRKNHNLGGHSNLARLLTEYSKVQNMNRYFISRFDSLHKIFIKSIGKDKKNCDISELKIFSRDLDQILDCKNQLKNFLSSNKALNKNKDQIKFNDILDELAKFIVLKTDKNQSTFEKIFNNQ